MGGKRAVIQTTAPISPGSSGGGLFDASGELVGLTTFTLQDSQNLNFAVPLSDVMGLLTSGPQEVTPENLLLLTKVTSPNCSESTPSLDAMVIGQQVLGREISEPQVIATLKMLNGGKDPTPTRVEAAKGAGEFRSYYFYTTGVSIFFLEGRCVTVNFYRAFSGILPLGLAWDRSRSDVQRLIGQPTESQKSNDGFIDHYWNFGKYRYDVIYETPPPGIVLPSGFPSIMPLTLISVSGGPS